MFDADDNIETVTITATDNSADEGTQNLTATIIPDPDKPLPPGWGIAANQLETTSGVLQFYGNTLPITITDDDRPVE